jgi:hypothetical protein
MANVTFNFEYDLPDEYLHQTSELGLKGEWTYTGPDKFFVFVDNETGKLEVSMSTDPYNAKDVEGSTALANLRAGLARTAVLVEAAQEPVIASFYQYYDAATLPQKEYKINKVVYYSRPNPTIPDHTYEVSDVVYDFETASFVKPFTWKKPHITAEEHDNARLRILAGAIEELEDPDSEISDELRTKLVAFKEELEGIPTKFAGWSPWQIPFPNDPRWEQPSLTV